MFDHGHNDGVILQPAPVLLKPCTITLGAGQANPTLTAGRIINPLHRRPGVSSRFDHGHHDAGCARIHDPFDLVRMVRSQPHNGRTPLPVKHLNQGLNFTQLQHTVFHIQHQPVKPGGSHDLGYRRVSQCDPRAYGQLTLGQFRFQLHKHSLIKAAAMLPQAPPDFNRR